MAIQRITPFLWFDTQAEEAAEFYCSIFPNSKVGEIRCFGETGPGPNGSAMTVAFELDGLSFIGLNGGPMFKFTEALSLMVNCETQEGLAARLLRSSRAAEPTVTPPICQQGVPS